MDSDRFCQLWKRCAVAGGGRAEAVFAELDAHYREPHRHYHTGRHIEDCLARMDMAASALGRSDSVELAVWFHDVIYASGAACDNEARSAEWFAAKAAGSLPPELIREVEHYILCTTHRQVPADDGAKFVVDVDLSGMGQSPESFRHDGDNIRREFPELGDAEFYPAQSRFLQKLLDRERIYATDFFHDMCEANARRNIRETLKRDARWGR